MNLRFGLRNRVWVGVEAKEWSKWMRAIILVVRGMDVRSERNYGRRANLYSLAAVVICLARPQSWPKHY